MQTIDQAVKRLQATYSTQGPYYLSAFQRPNGAQSLYQFLKQAYRPVFGNQERILIVQDCVDQYRYSDLPGQALRSLQRMVSEIDISNYFILVVTPNQNIAQELEQARTLYSTDDLPMQFELVPGLEYQPQLATVDSFCPLPWMHLYVGPQGDVLPCCVANHQFALGNINQQPLDHIVNSEKFTQLRGNMLSGRACKECDRCYQQEESGIVSVRQQSLRRWPLSPVNLESTVADFEPRYLDLRLNNICNLKCRMCDGYFSSAIAQEQVKLFGNKTIELNMNSSSRAQALEQLISYLPHAEKIYFAGGEPLLAPEHYEILNELIRVGNTNLEIFYNTNFTTLTWRDQSVLDLWKSFGNVTVGASVDAQGSVAEYVRHGTQWSEIERNIQLLAHACPHVKFTVTSVAGLLNVSSLIELQQQWHHRSLVNIKQFTVTTLISPDHLTLQVLPQHHKARVQTQIQDHIGWCRLNQANSLADQWQSVLNFMLTSDCTHLLPKFQTLTRQLDHHRSESLAQAVPELSDLL